MIRGGVGRHELRLAGGKTIDFCGWGWSLDTFGNVRRLVSHVSILIVVSTRQMIVREFMLPP
jgi:hypothetical protein